MGAHPVSATEFEGLLEDLARSLRTPQERLFGPDSLSWKVNRESALFLGAGRAALLQLAHPWVAAAIAQHSRTLDNPVRRFHHTFRVIFTMMFGSAEQAFTAARQLHRLHQQIRGTLPDAAGCFPQGTAYEANELAALTWVYATLVDSALVVYELLLPALSQDERERYFAESLRMAALFGISPRTLPQSWEAFRIYSTRRSSPIPSESAPRRAPLRRSCRREPASSYRHHAGIDHLPCGFCRRAFATSSSFLSAYAKRKPLIARSM